MSMQPKSTLPDPAMEITRSILTEAAQRPWLAALLMRRRPGWLTRLAQLAQQVRDLPRHTRRALRRKLASGLAAAALLLALTGTPAAYAGTVTVNGGCTLANAITTANTGINTGGCTGVTPGVAPDTITLSADVTLTAALPDIASDITIEGGGHTISGNNSFRVMNIASGIVTINQAIITGGNAPEGAGIFNSGTLTVMNSTISNNTATLHEGGGIRNEGTLTVQNSTISGNGATYGGGIFNNGSIASVQNSTISGNTANGGGGIYNYAGMLTVQNSTIKNNTAVHGGGGINIDASSTLTMTNSTLSGNTAGYGGGIFNNHNATVTNSTISGNTAADSYGGGISNSGTLTVQNSTIHLNKAGSGRGIWNDGTTTVMNSIVAGNADLNGSTALLPEDCNGHVPIISSGYNIEGYETCGFTGTGDQQNVYNGTLDLLNLLPLADNGGPTWTNALGSGSAALEKIPAGINGCGTTITTDQRGYVRPGTKNQPTNKCEIGAWEAQTTDPYPSAITLLDLTATANTAPGVIGAMGAALAALGALWVGRRRLK